VQAGVYIEPVIQVTKSVVMIGEDGAVLDGSSGQELIKVLANDVSISGFLFRNVPKTFIDDRSAVRIEGAERCRIDNNRFENTFFAIYLAAAVDCDVRNNIIIGYAVRESQGGNAIHSWYSRGLSITNNTITGHRDGIYLEFTEDSIVSGNTSTDNLRYGLHFMFSDRCSYVENNFERNGAGAAVMYGDDVTMLRNRFVDAWGASSYGLLLKEIKDGRVEGNTFSGNSVALLVEGTDRVQFEGNKFLDNGWALKLMANATQNELNCNTFQGNSFDVSTNSLSAPSTFSGNYWDRYDGYDLDRDGVGDVPFRPVRLFSVIVERYEASLVLLHSMLVDALDAAEKVLPVLTPDTLVDSTPLMRRPY